MKQLKNYEIRQPQSFEEFKKGVFFLSNLYKRKYGTYPLELPDQLFLAFNKLENNKIVGTINLNIKRPQKKLEIEKYFNLDLSKIYFGSKYKIGEISRFSSIDSYITPYLFCAISLFAKKIGIDFFIAFGTKLIKNTIENKYKFHFNEHNCSLRKQSIIKQYYPYFFNNNKPLIIGTQYVSAWDQRILDLTKSGEDIVKFFIPDSSQNMKNYHEKFKSTNWSMLEVNE